MRKVVLLMNKMTVGYTIFDYSIGYNSIVKNKLKIWLSIHLKLKKGAG